MLIELGPAVAKGLLPTTLSLPNGATLSAYGTGSAPVRLTISGIFLAIEEAKVGVPTEVTIGSTTIIYTPKGLPVIGPTANA